MIYKVLDYFTDLQDDSYAYNEGDTYPREGLNLSEARIHELASDDNVRGVPVIEVMEAESETVEESADEVEPTEKPKKGRGTSKK